LYMKKVNKDFEELLRLLEKNKVKYMIVGGYAVAFHGFPRFTKDIDIFYSAEEKNIISLRKALVEFGFSEQQIPSEVFTEKGDVLKFGIEPIRVDLLNEIDGVEFSEAYKSCEKGNFGIVPASFIGLEMLLKNKRSSGRTQDKLDVEKLTG
jgi:hypothetical protein